MGSELKINMIKLEKYIIIRFDEVPKDIKVDLCGHSDHFKWRFVLSIDEKYRLERGQSLVPHGGGFYRWKHITIKVDPTNEGVYKIKFKNNYERDSFYDGFLVFLKNIK